MRIGFIGLGNMGRHMARHLIHAGHLVTVHDSRPEAAAEHLALGARWADTPAACAEDAELLITMLPNPRIPPEGVETEYFQRGNVEVAAQWWRTSRKLRSLVLKWAPPASAAPSNPK